MEFDHVSSILINDLKFSKNSIDKLIFLKNSIIEFNKNYNLISKSTESHIWSRHILDSAQLVKYIDFDDEKHLSDFGTGAGFPGIVIAIYNNNPKFHVNLHEKSPVKIKFLSKLLLDIDLKVKIMPGNLKDQKINGDYIVCRAFKKLPEILRISREIAKKPYKIIILKGKSAQEEVDNALKQSSFEYKLFNSMTDKESKVLIIDVLK
jgi:16S rRNA (guanine527-N7)-methyltransferase